MSDLETRLTESLDAAGGRAPGPEGLVTGARRRVHRRRGLRAVVVAALAVSAVPVGLALDRGLDRTDRPSQVGTSDEPHSMTIGRVETWRDLQITVPDDWGYGNLSTWCLDRGSGRALDDLAQVERPGGAVRSIRCAGPAQGYGARFADRQSTSALPGRMGDRSVEPAASVADGGFFPKGSWLGSFRADSAVVLVVAPDRATAQFIVDSARQVEIDANGCATTVELAEGRTEPATDRMRVCRYSADGWLEQSELLSAQDTARAEEALQSAPAIDVPPSCSVPPPGRASVEIRLTGESAWRVLVHRRLCERGVWDEGEAWRGLTGDVLYWALSPGWFGSLPRGVPLPPQRRR